MIKFDSLPPDLAFLEEILGAREDQYCEAFWVKSPYHSDVWDCQFGDKLNFVIDFKVKIDDGLLLTKPRHTNLLNIFKSFFCVQTHFDCTGGLLLAPSVAYRRVLRAIYIVDYILLNSAKLKLSKYGLGYLSENDIKEIIFNIASSSEISNGLYCWPEKLSDFLRIKGRLISESDLNQFTKRMPCILDLPPETEEKVLTLSNVELIRARIWLFNNNLYRRRSSDIQSYIYSPNTKLLSREIYANTLRGKSAKPVPTELCFHPVDRYVREFKAVPVRDDSPGTISDKTFYPYISTIRSLGLLAEIGMEVPVNTLKSLDEKNIYECLKIKDVGRYLTLPKNVVFTSLRCSIEFALKYGDDLVASYINIAKNAELAGLTCQSYSYKFGITPLLTGNARELGIQSWSLNEHLNLFGKESVIKGFARIDKQANFEAFRSNNSFWELLRVLYGSVQVCVGTLMARRQGAILELVAGKCIDLSGSRLIFDNRKSGTFGVREKAARPILSIAVKMIRLLETLQKELIRIGLLEKYTSLLAYPKMTGKGLVKLSADQFNSSLDYFCDYFETQVDGNQQRYYIRQHSLRRFFVLLFFWGSSFGSMDTLRWFLCHSDVEHLYRYITEGIPGEVLKSIKSNYAASLAISNADEASELAQLLEEHFNTRNFSVLDSEELDQYIEVLMNEGAVEIEPEFFNTPDGKSYRILVIVKKIKV